MRRTHRRRPAPLPDCRAQFDAWWHAETPLAFPNPPAFAASPFTGPSPSSAITAAFHIFADNDQDLFFGFGYAVAQDRLFQLDYLRRRGSGRLAEILGADGTELDLMARAFGFRSILELDLLARTVGLRRIAEREWDTLSADVRALIAAFSDGINAGLDECRDRMPIEFDLLDYRPEPWSPIDCLTIEGEFRWYLTGRFPVIILPELVRRARRWPPTVPSSMSRQTTRASCRPLLPCVAVRYATRRRCRGPPGSDAGSNNWVVAGNRSSTGKPLVASDPHIAFDAVSCWYEVHLCGGSFNVAGAAYAGMPAVLFGRNERVAWGCTNNILSQRDLYQEKTDPNCFLTMADGTGDRARDHSHEGGSRRKTIRQSRWAGVDEVLPPAARQQVSRSNGWEHITAFADGLLSMNRSRNAGEREACSPGTWSLQRGLRRYDGAHRISGNRPYPIRNVWERASAPAGIDISGRDSSLSRGRTGATPSAAGSPPRTIAQRPRIFPIHCRGRGATACVPAAFAR
jgi:hypothetical protein